MRALARQPLPTPAPQEWRQLLPARPWTPGLHGPRGAGACARRLPGSVLYLLQRYLQRYLRGYLAGVSQVHGRLQVLQTWLQPSATLQPVAPAS